MPCQGEPNRPKLKLTARRPGRDAFTLVEVAFSLVILATAVTFTILILGGALRDQQINRYRILAAAKAVSLIEKFSQPQEDYRAGGNTSWNVRYNMNETRKEYAKGTVGLWQNIGAQYLTNIPAVMTGGRYDLERVVGSSAGGAYPVPAAIARRIDSDQDEISKLYDRGGKLFYFDPSERSGSNLTAGKVTGANRNAATTDLQRLVFAVIGQPQQNALPNHPWIVPSVKLYPYPPSHLTDEGENPGSLRVWSSGPHSPGVVHRGSASGATAADGFGVFGTIFAQFPNSGWKLGGEPWTEVGKFMRTSPTLPLGSPYHGERTDSSDWEWQAFLDANSPAAQAKLTTIAWRDRVLRGQDPAPYLPSSATEWNATGPTPARWSPWLAGLPEFRRLLHWHWNRIYAQLAPTTITTYPTPIKEIDVDIYEAVSEFIDPWPTQTITWSDAKGEMHTYEAPITPRPTRTVYKFVRTVKQKTGGQGKSTAYHGLPTPPNGLGKAVGLRGTDILYEDHEPFPGNRLEQIRQGLPSLERRVMYRTAALALWAKTRLGKSIFTAEARLLGAEKGGGRDPGQNPGDPLDFDPNVVTKDDPARANLPDRLNPLLTYIEPPADPADIHPAQVLALNYLAHAAMLVTGYRPPFVDNNNTLDAKQHRDLHKGPPNFSGSDLSRRYYRKFGQETFYLANPLYCEKALDFLASDKNRNSCAANIATRPWVETSFASAWIANTNYPAGSTVSNNGAIYQCTTGGTSAKDGAGPTATGAGITDGSCVWSSLPGTPESYAKAKIWSMLCDNYDRSLIKATEGTFVLDPGGAPMSLDDPQPLRLTVTGTAGERIKVRRFFEGGSYYRDWRGRGRPNATWNALSNSTDWEPCPNGPVAPAKADDDPYVCTATPDGGKWRPGRWGLENYPQDFDPSVSGSATPDALNDDAVVNPFPPPFAQEGAFDCWGNQRFSWRVLAPVGSLSKPKSSDFHQLRSFAIGSLQDIAYNDSSHWKADLNGAPWSSDDVLCGPIEAQYVSAMPKSGVLPTDCDDLLMAKNAVRTCLAWVMKYTSSRPNDFIVPKPANALNAWHRPIFYFDPFNNDITGSARRQTDPVNWALSHPVAWLGEATFPAVIAPQTALWTTDSLAGAYAPPNLNMYGPLHLNAYPASAVRKDKVVDQADRSPPPWSMNPDQANEAGYLAQYQDHAYKDILRAGPPMLDGEAWPEGYFAGMKSASILGALHGFDGFGWDHKSNPKPKAPTDSTIQPQLFTKANPARQTSPSSVRTWITDPFKTADRCRQVVFWVVDWKSYEDSEILPSDPIDMSQTNVRPYEYYTHMISTVGPNPLHNVGNPERMLCWLNPARDRTVANSRYMESSRLQAGPHPTNYGPARYFDTRSDLGLQGMPVAELTGGDESGDQQGWWFYASLGRFGADRDGNGSLSVGSVPPGVRLRAREVGRFVYYDPVLPLSTRK